VGLAIAGPALRWVSVGGRKVVRAGVGFGTYSVTATGCWNGSQEHAEGARCDSSSGKVVWGGHARQNAIVVEKHQFGSILRDRFFLSIPPFENDGWGVDDRLEKFSQDKISVRKMCTRVDDQARVLPMEPLSPGAARQRCPQETPSLGVQREIVL
jgi:hypothetical protein